MKIITTPQYRLAQSAPQQDYQYFQGGQIRRPRVAFPGAGQPFEAMIDGQWQGGFKSIDEAMQAVLPHDNSSQMNQEAEWERSNPSGAFQSSTGSTPNGHSGSLTLRQREKYRGQ